MVKVLPVPALASISRLPWRGKRSGSRVVTPTVAKSGAGGASKVSRVSNLCVHGWAGIISITRKSDRHCSGPLVYLFAALKSWMISRSAGGTEGAFEGNPPRVLHVFRKA